MELKLLIDKSKQKVVFAEADKGFVDFLFSLMTLPLGTFIRLLQNKDSVGCLGNVYDSINSMPETYFHQIDNKEAAQNPKFRMLSEAPLLLPDSHQLLRANQLMLYICEGRNNGSPQHAFVSDDPKSGCPRCGKTMAKAEWTKWCKSKEDGIVKEVARYMVMDNLEVKPMSTVSSFAIMKTFGIQDFDSLDEKLVDIKPAAQALKLLQLSFSTKNVLTATFFGA